LDLSTAESYLKGSEKLYAELGHQWEEAKIAEAQGHIERLRGNFELADTHLEKALSLYEQVGDPRSVVTTLEVLSTNTRHAGQLDRSTRFAEQCHALAIKNGNKPVLAKALTNLAFNCGPGLGNYDLGFVHQQKCVEIYEELGDSVNVAAAISRLGFYAAACGDFELGEEYLRRGLASLRETNSWYNVAWALQMLGFTLIARNQIKEAEKILLESKTTYQRLGAKDEALHGESRLIFTQRLYQNPKEIYRRLYEMLCTVLEKRMYYPIFGLLIVIAVVLSEQGYSDKKNQKKFSMLAIAVYEATDRNPTTSRLMLDVHGIAKPIYALLQAVPDKLARESQEQGKAMSIWQMAELLLEELPKLGWVKPQ
ncbi:MAG: tetratricopeptide repeat protein, partial [Chloroflexota bacterium]